MAKKSGSKGSLSYDYHNLTPDQKQKLGAVCDQFPEIKRDMVAIVLDHYDFDQDKAIDALTGDGGSSAFTSWKNQMENSQTKANKNKKNKKKKGKKDGSQMINVAVSCIDADDSSSLHSSNIDYDPEKEIQAKSEDCDDSIIKSEKDSYDNCNSDHTDSAPLPIESSSSEEKIISSPVASDYPDKKVNESSVGETNINCDQGSTYYEANEEEVPERNVDTDGTLERNEEHSRNSQKYHHRQRHSSSQHSKSSSISEDTQSNQSKRGGLVKCTKDLNRQTVSLQRIELQLNSKLEEASKYLKTTFTDIRKMLDKRQAELEEELSKVKTEALNLLKSRQDLASELKRKVDRAMAMNESDWNDLRADIKQFVTERKYDDELGKTIWFHWSMDKITEAINNLGEICPVKNSYSQRQHSSSASKSPEPSAADSNASGKETINDNQGSLGLANSSTSNEEPEEGKSIKELHNRNPGQSGLQNSRVFCSTRYQGRFLANHNRGKGFYRSNRGGYSRGRHFESYPQYGGNGRYNDYRKQYHYDRNDYNQLTSDKSVESHGQETGESSAPSASYSSNARENHGHYKGGYDKKSYSNYNRPPRAHNQFGKQGGGRVRYNSDIGMNSEMSDKVANQNSQQKGQDMVNGY